MVFTDGSRILFPGEGLYFGSKTSYDERPDPYAWLYRWDLLDWPKPGDHPEPAYERPKISS